MRLEFGPHTIAYGRQPGAEKVLDILRTELLAIMQQVGAPTIKHLVPGMAAGLVVPKPADPAGGLDAQIRLSVASNA
jgi:hypothetical protein